MKILKFFIFICFPSPPVFSAFYHILYVYTRSQLEKWEEKHILIFVPIWQIDNFWIFEFFFTFGGCDVLLQGSNLVQLGYVRLYLSMLPKFTALEGNACNSVLWEFEKLTNFDNFGNWRIGKLRVRTTFLFEVRLYESCLTQMQQISDVTRDSFTEKEKYDTIWPKFSNCLNLCEKENQKINLRVQRPSTRTRQSSYSRRLGACGLQKFTKFGKFDNLTILQICPISHELSTLCDFFFI